MSFHEIRFPANLSFGSSGGPERRTEIVTLANGFEERNTPWEHARRRYDAGVGLRSLDDIEALIAFFEARRGQLFGFRWKDWADYKSCLPNSDVGPDDQEIGRGDGATTEFQLSKTYASGEHTYSRPITKPVAASVKVSVDGLTQVETLDFTVNTETGVITLTEAPDVGVQVSAGFEFDVPVRFDTDSIQTSVSSFRAGDVPRVPIVEVRV